MPCRSDYDDKDINEREKIIGFLKEFYTDIPHPRFKVRNLDDLTAQLCGLCETSDVKAYSLELQIWWRDHQKADAIRQQREIEQAKAEKAKKSGLAKLTDYEKKVLGLNIF